MGNLSNAMGTLVEQIRSSTLARHSEVESIRDRTKAFREASESERKKMAETLTSRLATALRGIKSEVKLLRDQFVRATTQRKVTISEIRSAVSGGLERNRIQRQENGEVFLKKMRQTAKARQKEVDDLKSGVRALRGDFRRALTATASDVAQAGGLWRGVREKKTAPRRPAAEVEAKPSAQGEEEEKSLAQLPAAARRILRIIERHREGVRLVDIGNQLGVDWRNLIGPIRVLMEQGKIEKVESLYYPVQA